jgi:molybdopterin synthase catalytic subunit
MVRIRLFAVAREIAGADFLDVDVAEPATARNVLQSLVVQVPALERVVAHSILAVDGEFASGDTPIPKWPSSPQAVEGRMEPTVRLVNTPIDGTGLIAGVTSPDAGAVVLFLGTTRAVTAGRHTLALDYEAYGEMAERKLRELADEAMRRWPVVHCGIVHRLGRVPLAEPSVAVAVSTPHRQDAFEAGKWLIDTLKESVPIWKRETWADGTTEWVHPGLTENDE